MTRKKQRSEIFGFRGSNSVIKVGFFIKSTIAFSMAIALSFYLSSCADDEPLAPEEVIFTPASPVGPESTAVGNTASYFTWGASSSFEHSLEYRFDWGDGIQSAWSPSPIASHSWSEEGVYDAKAQARCAVHTGKISSWSSGSPVFIGEAISTPDAPLGPSYADINQSETFSTGRAKSSSGHPVEYRFDWGDGSSSPWSDDTSASHSWMGEGNFSIEAQARCKVHTERTSSWSGEKILLVGETISTPAIPEGHTTVTVNRVTDYCTANATSSRGHPLLYQFTWEGITIPLWTSSECATMYWPSDGNFSIRVRACCALHPQAVSEWSDALHVWVTSDEVITTPDTPAGPSDSETGETGTYSTGGAYSSSGHAIEYWFDWGDGSQSSWSASTSASHSWSVGGSYLVRAQARCIQHYVNISPWSDAIMVTVTAPGSPHR